MKFNRAAPFLGPFSGPKKWTAGDVPHSGYMFQHGSRTKVRSARRYHFCCLKKAWSPEVN